MQVKRKRLIPKPDIVIQMLWNVWDMKNGMQMFSPKSSAKGSPVIIDAIGSNLAVIFMKVDKHLLQNCQVVHLTN